jgi:hypothetical protein
LGRWRHGRKVRPARQSLERSHSMELGSQHCGARLGLPISGIAEAGKAEHQHRPRGGLGDGRGSRRAALDVIVFDAIELAGEGGAIAVSRRVRPDGEELRVNIMRSPHPLFWELAFVMPRRDSCASALAPPRARGLSKTQAAGIPDASSGGRQQPGRHPYARVCCAYPGAFRRTPPIGFIPALPANSSPVRPPGHACWMR